MDVRSEYVYQNLPADSIRLLRLHPGSQDEPLVGSLFSVGIDAPPKYEAISYVWGDPESFTSIECDGQILKLGHNLGEVLRRVRFPDEVRTLWADAICINQSDREEREIQVGVMGNIFALASRVVAWVGEGDGGESAAVNLIRRMIERFEQLRGDSGSIKDIPPITAEETASLIESDPQAWKSIKKMLDSPLFGRVWIIQELGLGTDVILLFGSASIDWLKLVRVCDLIRWKAIGLVNTLNLHPYRVWNSYRVYATREQLKVLFEYKQPRPLALLEVLVSGRDHQASDDRDRVYALLGHTSAWAEGSLIIQPDYARSVEDTYCELAMRLVQLSKSLALLSAVQHEEDFHESSLPSWVPLWSKPLRSLMFGIKRRPYYSAAPNQEEHMTLNQDQKWLTVRGMSVDTITTSTNELSWEDLRIDCGGKSCKGTANFEFLSKINLGMDGMRHQYEDAFLSELLITLTAGLHDTSPLRQAQKTMEQHRADFAAYWLALNGELAFEDQSLGFPLRLSPTWQENLRNFADVGDAQRFEENLTACVGRKLFRTSSGHIGLGPRPLREGDICCVLFGARVPVLLRRVDDHYLFIGELYLHEFMWGKAVKMFRDGELELQEYELH